MVENLVTLCVDDRGATIPATLFGHNVEFIGRCIYDGVWVGEDSPVPNDDGLRLDTIEAYRQLRASTMRLGGTFGEYYHWRDGIGPRAQRRKSRNLFWGGYESNQFGTDEFLRWCAAIGAEPIIQVNVATGSRREALEWMEYCNASPLSELAEERRRNGHPEPYGVKYWQIGNENLILHSPEEYAREVRRFGVYMRQAEPDARLMVRGTWDLRSDFNQRLLAVISNQSYLIDLLSIHCYTYPPPLAPGDETAIYKVIAGAELVERQILRAAAAIDLYASGEKHIGIIVDEYGAHHHETTFGFPIRELPNGMEQPSFLRDAILAARVLHVFMRQADRVSAANLSISINVLHAALKTDGSLLIRTPTFHVLDMLKEHMNADAVRVHGDLGVFEVAQEHKSDTLPKLGGFGVSEVAQDGDAHTLPNLDIVASATSDGQGVFVSIVNLRLDRTENIRLRVRGDDDYKIGSATATVLTGSDPLDVNDSEKPDRIKPWAVLLHKEGEELVLSCAPFSLTGVKIVRAESRAAIP